MCTVIKVKRKITDDPVDCLILECNKRKKLMPDLAELSNNETNNETTKNRIDSIKQILKYAGSAKNENEISERLIELSSNLKSTIENFKSNPKTPKPSNPKETQIRETKKETKAHRYVLLNKKRGVENLNEQTIETITNKEKSLDKTELAINNYGEMNIIDVVSSEYDDNYKKEADNEKITCNGIELIKEKVPQPVKYVYDLYYAKNNEIHLDLLYPNNFTINSLDIQFDDNIFEEPEEFYEDDEDSNDEGNWRNDYPDDDDDIDNEDDQDGYLCHNVNIDGYNDYDEDEDYKLSAFLKKSCNLDRSFYEDEELSDDFDDYEGEDSKSYSAYKRKLIKDLEK